MSDPRASGDDVTIHLRVRRANLHTLEAGVRLGIDSLTGEAIEIRLVPGRDGVHELEVVTNALPMMATHDPVNVERLDRSGCDRTRGHE